LISARDSLRFAAQRALSLLAERGWELSAEPSDLACTFLLVIAHRDLVAAAHVGDGGIVVINEAGDLISLTTPTNGEFANETALLGCAKGTDVGISTLAGFQVKSIAAFTDGLQRVALQMPGGTPHAPFFLPLFARLRNMKESERERFIGEFLGSARIAARTDDDKTLVVANLL
jgi:hypothetical protein